MKEGKVKVIPNTLWPIATIGEVLDIPRKRSLNEVPILIIPLCPANLTVVRNEFPRGVVILNDCPIPINAATIELDRELASESPWPVELSNNSERPYGKVILWD